MHTRPKALIVNCNAGHKSQGIPALEIMVETIGFENKTVNAFENPDDLPDSAAGYDFIVFSGGPGDPAQPDGDNRGKWNDKTAALAHDVLARNAAFPDAPVYAQFICLSHQNLMQHAGLTTSLRTKPKVGVHSETLLDGTVIHTMANQKYQVDDNGACATLDLHGLTMRTTSVCPEAKAVVAAEITNANGIVVARSTQYHPEATVASVSGLLDNPVFQEDVTKHHGENAIDIQRGLVAELQHENAKLYAFAQTAYDAAMGRRGATVTAVTAGRMSPAA